MRCLCSESIFRLVHFSFAIINLVFSMYPYKQKQSKNAFIHAPFFISITVKCRPKISSSCFFTLPFFCERVLKHSVFCLFNFVRSKVGLRYSPLALALVRPINQPITHKTDLISVDTFTPHNDSSMCVAKYSFCLQSKQAINAFSFALWYLFDAAVDEKCVALRI